MLCVIESLNGFHSAIRRRLNFHIDRKFIAKDQKKLLKDFFLFMLIFIGSQKKHSHRSISMLSSLTNTIFIGHTKFQSNSCNTWLTIKLTSKKSKEINNLKSYKLILKHCSIMATPSDDSWKKKYDFNPKAKVTMPANRDSCPSVNPFEKKPEEPKPAAPISKASSSGSSSSSFLKSPFRSKSKDKSKSSSTMTSSTQGSHSIFNKKSCTQESKRDKQNGCKQS